jgi:hypothetical protein
LSLAIEGGDFVPELDLTIDLKSGGIFELVKLIL